MKPWKSRVIVDALVRHNNEQRRELSLNRHVIDDLRRELTNTRKERDEALAKLDGDPQVELDELRVEYEMVATERRRVEAELAQVKDKLIAAETRLGRAERNADVIELVRHLRNIAGTWRNPFDVTPKQVVRVAFNHSSRCLIDNALFPFTMIPVEPAAPLAVEVADVDA